MKLLRNIIIGVALLVLPRMSQAVDRVYSIPPQLNAAGATETVVVVSTGSTASLAAGIVLAANASRMDFDIEVTSCTVSTSKVWYAYDSGFNLALSSNTAANWVNFSLADPSQRKFKKPDWIMPVGAIYAATDGAANSCVVVVREWVSTSPVFQ